MLKFHVQRSTVIDAPPEDVYRTVVDYETWTTWSPWLCAEPDAEVKVTENSSDVGAVYTWSGEIVGAGEIEHLNLKPGELIEDEIRFIKPFKSVSEVSFEFAPSENGTKVTWHMKGKLPWFMFWMTPMMETYVGMDYERGLKMLKEWVETGAMPTRTIIDGTTQVGPLRVVGVRKTCSFEDIGESMETAFTHVSNVMKENDLPGDGQCVSIYHDMNMKKRTFEFTSGFTIPDSVSTVPDQLTSCSIPNVKALGVQHIGRYDFLGNAWSAAHQYIRYKKLKHGSHDAFEIYTNDPANTLPADLNTQIYVPLK